MTLHEFYENPLCGRYADEEMKRLFSDDWKFSTWRRLWVALAESEQALGLPITDEQLCELGAHISDIDYDAAARHEHGARVYYQVDRDRLPNGSVSAVHGVPLAFTGRHSMS
jgi:hypothetical protein